MCMDYAKDVAYRSSEPPWRATWLIYMTPGLTPAISLASNKATRQRGKTLSWLTASRDSISAMICLPSAKYAAPTACRTGKPASAARISTARPLPPAHPTRRAAPAFDGCCQASHWRSSTTPVVFSLKIHPSMFTQVPGLVARDGRLGHFKELRHLAAAYVPIFG